MMTIIDNSSINNKGRLNMKSLATSVVLSSDDEAARERVIPSLRQPLRRLVYQHKYGTVELHSDSLECLRSECYLKDNIIQFYTSYLWNQCPDSLAKRIHIFDTIFFSELGKAFGKEKVDANKWRQLHKWYSDVDLSKKDYLIFPVCQDDHWVVIVVCYADHVKPVLSKLSSNNSNPKEERRRSESHKQLSTENLDEEIYHNATEEMNPPDNVPLKDTTKKGLNMEPGIIVMDSLGLKNKKLTGTIRDFLYFGLRGPPGSPIRRFSHHDMADYFPSLPKQNNAYDCGMYVCHYMKCFLSDPTEFYRLVRTNDSESRHKLRGKINDYLGEGDRDCLKKLITDVCQSQPA